jgi:hypothetical protein
MTFHGCPRLQRQQQELNNKIIITPLYIRQIHITLSSPPFSLSGRLLTTFHVKILYAIFRRPSELHVRPKLSLLLKRFNQNFYIYLLFLHAPRASNFMLPPLSHFTGAAGRCHMDGGDDRAGGFLLLFYSPFVLCQQTQSACRKRGISLSTFMCIQRLENWRGIQGSTAH